LKAFDNLYPNSCSFVSCCVQAGLTLWPVFLFSPLRPNLFPRRPQHFQCCPVWSMYVVLVSHFLVSPSQVALEHFLITFPFWILCPPPILQVVARHSTVPLSGRPSFRVCLTPLAFFPHLPLSLSFHVRIQPAVSVVRAPLAPFHPAPLRI